MTPSLQSIAFPAVAPRTFVESLTQPAGTPALPAEQISIHRDTPAGDWIVDFSQGIDLLEISQVLNAVQQRALELLATQVAALGHVSQSS